MASATYSRTITVSRPITKPWLNEATVAETLDFIVTYGPARIEGQIVKGCARLAI